ncbi:MAG UNVERIFIED_CONTAM: hypothetical protein LVR18_34025 [Planctomycetaceae bacterium]
MEEALEALRQQQREEALKNEDKAAEELQEAAEKLEKELQQLREEEKEMVLASLEARFQRMLLLQTEIHDGTKVLAATPKADWLDLNYSRCKELAQQQLELSRECSRTVVLLRKDGSAAAILLAVEDIETDMQSVSGWLQNSDVSELTLSVQQDIIDSLRQLIETTQKNCRTCRTPTSSLSRPSPVHNSSGSWNSWRKLKCSATCSCRSTGVQNRSIHWSPLPTPPLCHDSKPRSANLQNASKDFSKLQRIWQKRRKRTARKMTSPKTARLRQLKEHPNGH